jgi:hypothetical protein
VEIEFENTTYSKQTKLVAIPMSQDQTPYRKDELERLLKAGASIMTMDQKNGDAPVGKWENLELGKVIDVRGDPPRVWVEGKDYPGCAFSRSLGDQLADDIGVFAEPEMMSTELSADDEILVIATDGIFEFLTNQDVIDICADCSNPIEACEKVVKASYKQWLIHENRTDDITVIVCFLNCSDSGHIENGVRSNVRTSVVDVRPPGPEANGELFDDEKKTDSDEHRKTPQYISNLSSAAESA